MNIANVLLVATCAGLFIAGCSSTPMQTPSPEKSTAAPTASVPVPIVKPAPVANAMPAYLDLQNPLYTNRSIYFSYDDYSVKKEYAAMIETHGKYLAAHPAVAIKIEGSADERGGSEYNLALGQKRAEAALRALKAYGVKDAQLEAVSWGKEKPKATGHDEAAWAQNRRADLDYPTR